MMEIFGTKKVEIGFFAEMDLGCRLVEKRRLFDTVKELDERNQ